MKYAWVQTHCDSFPVALMCDVLAVSRSGYYASLERPLSPRAQRSVRIRGRCGRRMPSRTAFMAARRSPRRLRAG